MIYKNEITMRPIRTDSEGSVLVEDPSGNKYFMDGKGNINLTSPKDINLNVGENFNISVGKNMNINVGQNINEVAGMNHFISAMMNIFQNAGGDYFLMAKNITEIAKKDRKSSSKEVTDQSKEKKILIKDNNKVHSKGTFESNTNENSNSN